MKIFYCSIHYIDTCSTVVSSNFIHHIINKRHIRDGTWTTTATALLTIICCCRRLSSSSVVATIFTSINITRTIRSFIMIREDGILQSVTTHEYTYNSIEGIGSVCVRCCVGKDEN